MAIRTDCHSHSFFSSDSQAPLEKMAEAARKKGMAQLCLTEHLDWDFPFPARQERGMDFIVDTDSYQAALNRFRQGCPKDFFLGFGIELGLQPHLASRLTDCLERYPFDFVIGSSHLSHGKDPYYPSFYEGRSEEEAYREYFTSIRENIQAFDGFDVYGHLDYVVRYGPGKDSQYSYGKYGDILDEILRLLIEKGKGIEINTAGLRQGLKDVHPCTGIIRRYRKLGGEIITVGSDAHRPEHIGANFKQAEEALKSCGFSYYTVFKERKPEFIAL